jgi:hypothetical protein
VEKYTASEAPTKNEFCAALLSCVLPHHRHYESLDRFEKGNFRFVCEHRKPVRPARGRFLNDKSIRTFR